MKRDLYAEVSRRIIAELESGAAPWVKPWSANPGANTPCNAVSNRPYSGCNVVLLWMAQAAGGTNMFPFRVHDDYCPRADPHGAGVFVWVRHVGAS
jgi:antirestriction protein ArdC